MPEKPFVRPIELLDYEQLSRYVQMIDDDRRADLLRSVTDRRACLIGELSEDECQSVLNYARASGIEALKGRQTQKGGERLLLVGSHAQFRLAEELLAKDEPVGSTIARRMRTFRPPKRLELPRRVLSWTEKPLVQAIMNITPDSFYDRSRCQTPADAVSRAEGAIAQGADIIDIGGESTRPGATPVDAETEMSRVLPVIEALVARTDVPISIDTTKASVARAALAAGAQIVNDVSGLRADSEMAECVARAGAGVVVMHMRGTPRTMQVDTDYESLMGEICASLDESIDIGLDAGIDRGRIVVDPGIGFGKTSADNLVILRELGALQHLGCPILVGSSRKSFLGKEFGWEPEERLHGSVASAVAAVMGGAAIVRVHDVLETRRAVDVAWKIRNAGTGESWPGRG